MMQNKNKIIFEYAKKALKIGEINLEKNKIKINNKNYSKKELLINACDFKIFNSEKIEIKNNKLGLRNDEIYHLFLANTFNTTKLGQILPCFIFLIISLISLSPAVLKQIRANFGFINLTGFQISLLILIGIIFLIFAFFLFINNFCLKSKIYLCKINGQIRLKHIRNKEYKNMIDIMQKNMYFKPIFFKPIESERLMIREFNFGDEFDVLEMLNNDSFTRYMTLKKINNIDESIKFIIDARKKYQLGIINRLAIIEKSTNKVIGLIGLSNKDLSIDTCQVIYGLNEGFWHKGYMTEALNSFLNYLYEQNKTFIIGGHIKENEASGKVMMRCGFERYAYFDTEMTINNKNVEIIEYIIDKRNNKNNEDEIC